MQNETSAVPGSGIGAIHAPVPVTGYRALTQEQVDLMNEGKALGLQVKAFIDKLEAANRDAQPPVPTNGLRKAVYVEPPFDGRWLSIARTDLQKGFMFLGRAIAKPEGF